MRTASDFDDRLVAALEELAVVLGSRLSTNVEFGTETVALMRTIKTAIDPQNILNPGKLLPTMT